jgi:hypothetical protein
MSDGIIMGEGNVQIRVEDPEETMNLETAAAIIRLEFQRLQEREKKLLALEGAGVDNWEGYDDAMSSLEEP